jgi:hypothetical protein
MPFIGAYVHSIDAKNRLSIPAVFRAAMHPERDGDQFYLVPGKRLGTLSFFGNRRFAALFENRPWGDYPLEDELSSRPPRRSRWTNKDASSCRSRR